MVIPAFQASIKTLRHNRKLFSNAFYLYIFQGLNYLLPLATIPYLVRILKTDTFGKLAFYGAFMVYFQILVDYGFNLSATRDASLLKTDTKGLSTLFCSVLIIKSAIFIACGVMLGILLSSIPRFHQEITLCCWLFLGVAGSILFPTWLFQGMEEMRYITIFNLASKLAVSFLYFILIKCPSDYLWFAYLNSSGAVIIAVVAFVVAIRKFKITLAFPGLDQCRKDLKKGFQIFASQASVTLFTNTNIFLLGLFTNNLIVGNYAVADKIVRACISLSGPITTAIYPRTAILFSQSRDLALRFLRKITLVGSALFGLASIALFVFANLLVGAVTGNRSANIAFYIRIMSLLPLSVFLDNMYGTQIMLNINLRKQFMNIIVGTGALSVFLMVILVPHFKGVGSATAYLFSEVSLLCFMVLTVRKAGIRLLPMRGIVRMVFGNLYNLLRYGAIMPGDRNRVHPDTAINGKILRAKIISSCNPLRSRNNGPDFEKIISREIMRDRPILDCGNNVGSGTGKKILFLSPVYEIGFGVGLVIEKQIQGLVKRGGYEIYLGVPGVENRYPGSGGVYRNVGLDCASTHALIKELRPDIVISHADPYHGHVAKFKQGHIIKIAYDHGEPPPDFFGFWDSINLKIKKHERQSAFKSFDFHISISEFIKKTSGVANSIVIYNGADHFPVNVDNPTINLRKDLDLPDDAFIVAALSRMGEGEAHYKGFDVLALVKEEVETLRHSDTIKFVIMGKSYREDNPVKIMLEEQEIHVLENVEEDRKQAYLSQSNLFISPSLWEGFNLPLVEAQSFGIPSTCLSVAAHPEVCPFAFDTIDDIARFIVFLHENPSMLTLASTICRKFVSKFTWDENLLELLNLLK